jgi:hypothetical protein
MAAAREKPEFLTLDGLNGYLMRDIGLSLHSDRYPHRDVRRNDERTDPRAAAICTDNHGANAGCAPLAVRVIGVDRQQ